MHLQLRILVEEELEIQNNEIKMSLPIQKIRIKLEALPGKTQWVLTSLWQWDILSNGGVVQEMAHIANGRETGNCVSLLRVNVSSIWWIYC